MMKREIKFRGKNKHNVWVYGYLSYSDNEDTYYIGVEELKMQVHPESVGQYTGLTDKNGKEIYEGSIVSFRGGKKPRNEERPFVTSEVVFKYGMFTVAKNTSMLNDDSVLKIDEVVGNTHDQ